MKIGEAREIYREQVNSYRRERSIIAKQLETLRSRMEISEKDREQYGSEAATLELTLTALDERQKEYREYLDDLSEQYCAYWNEAVAKQQAEAGEDYAVEMSKIMEVARRIMKGAIVPAADERKLMEFSQEMYQTAKSVGAMVQRQKQKKYDSLWGDEEEKEYEDPQEAAENAQALSAGPEIVDAETAMASVSNTVSGTE